MEVWIVVPLAVLAVSICVFGIYKGKKSKNKKWYVLSGLMGLYLVVCGLYILLDQMIAKRGV